MSKNANWKAIFAGITAIYLVAIILLPLLLQRYQVELGFTEGVGVFVDNAKLNSLADFIAGIFAPLAFFWLVAAVMIQSDELKLQRDEISENRHVMEEHAKAAKEQAEFIRVQTDLMREQGEMNRRVAEATYQASQFERRLALHEAIGEFCNIAQTNEGYTKENLNRFAELHLKAEYTFSEGVCGQINHFERNFASGVRASMDLNFLSDPELTEEQLRRIQEAYGVDFDREQLVDVLELYFDEQQEMCFWEITMGGMRAAMSDEMRMRDSLFPSERLAPRHPFMYDDDEDHADEKGEA